MKIILYSVAAMMLMATSCQDTPKADEAKTSDAQSAEVMATPAAEYKVDVQKSSIKWVGAKPTGTHPGVFALKEGRLQASGNVIQSGRFVIDLENLKAYDEDGAENSKLTGHLKSEDFFDVSRYNTATFEITNVEEGTGNDKVMMAGATHMITGNLKIKDINKGVTFPAKINMDEESVTADAEFNLDRTVWGITYGNDKSLGDKFIRPDVNVKVHLEATR
jgi:polyisoprenoid-binding protein YceI